MTQTSLTNFTAQEGPLARAGQAANAAAARRVFYDHMLRKADETKYRYRCDLKVFADFLASIGVATGDLYEEPEAWRGITWGLIETFKHWMLQESYAIGSIEDRLTTVKLFAKLAAKAGVVEAPELARIQEVRAYHALEGTRVDAERVRAGIAPRRSTKRNGKKTCRKSEPVPLTDEQARRLKSQPDTPRGRRDALLMSLLLDHGFRRCEVAMLCVENVHPSRESLRLYRKKVDKWQTHNLTADTWIALARYLELYPAEGGPLLLTTEAFGGKGQQKVPQLVYKGMSDRAIEARVRALGKAIGIPNLSPHDCRHFWATKAARNKTPIDRLRDAGGWSSFQMPALYILPGEIANEGVDLGE